MYYIISIDPHGYGEHDRILVWTYTGREFAVDMDACYAKQDGFGYKSKRYASAIASDLKKCGHLVSAVVDRAELFEYIGVHDWWTKGIKHASS